jgi:hypothetical protein
MKKRSLLSAQLILFGLFIFFLFATILQFFGNANPLLRFDHSKSVYNHVEAYDPALIRLNSLEKIEQYCDSIYSTKIFEDPSLKFETTYTEIVSTTIRNRFYHGYSYYSFNDNYLSTVVSKITIPGLNALVIPDEILKYPFAACSQQSIVMMEVLKNKGFQTRKVGFLGKKFGGHFAFEVFYNDGWHFHDPNLEPDKAVLDNYGRPGIAFLVHNPEILLKAYSRYPKEKILDIFPNYYYGPVNKFPAPKAIIFQKATKFLSYTIWLFFLIAFLIVRRKYLRSHVKMYVSDKTSGQQVQKTSSIYYPDYSNAQGA